MIVKLLWTMLCGAAVYLVVRNPAHDQNTMAAVVLAVACLWFLGVTAGGRRRR